MFYLHKDRNKTQDYMDILIMKTEQRGGQLEENQVNAHALINYESLLRRCQNPQIPFGSYPTFQDISISYGDIVHTSIVERKVKFR